MKHHIEAKVIHEEYLQLLKIIRTEEKKLGRPLTTQEENDILIPMIEEHYEELFEAALEHLGHRNQG